ncbi:hypothetical protein B484DRAFT_405963 [Ochromonadaceae sp. CCMP2298]|nr:hypothetical protein B484DRAFT_405963 [Ochromonadaceae sp. CCMP2298]
MSKANSPMAAVQAGRNREEIIDERTMGHFYWTLACWHLEEDRFETIGDSILNIANFMLDD